MKAAVYRRNGAPDVLCYEEVSDPLPGDREVLVRVEAISIEGGDLLNRQRMPPPTTETPHIVGYSAAGEIVALGRNVSAFKLGQKVTTFSPNGSHASLRVAREDCCWALPQGIDIKAAACVPAGLGTAYQALFDLGNLQAGQTVLIQGAAGGVGVAAVQLAQRAGARVIGTASSASHLQQLREFGLDEGIDYRTEDVVARVRELTNQQGVNLVIDSVGGASLQKAVDCLAVCGRVILVGMVDSAPYVVNAMDLVRGRKQLIGCLLGEMIHEPLVRAFIQALLARVASGELKVPIDRVFPLEQAAAAHAYAETRGRSLGRVIMVP